MPRVRVFDTGDVDEDDPDEGHLEDLDDLLEEEDRHRCFTYSRRRTRDDTKHTGRARRQVDVPHLSRLVEKGRVVQALVHVDVRDEGFSHSDMGIVRDLLKTVAQNGIQAASEVLSHVLSGLRACAEWFVENASPGAVQRICAMIPDHLRHLCEGCKLLAEILAPKVALVAA